MFGYPYNAILFDFWFVLIIFWKGYASASGNVIIYFQTEFKTIRETKRVTMPRWQSITHKLIVAESNRSYWIVTLTLITNTSVLEFKHKAN